VLKNGLLVFRKVSLWKLIGELQLVKRKRVLVSGAAMKLLDFISSSNPVGFCGLAKSFARTLRDSRSRKTPELALPQIGKGWEMRVLQVIVVARDDSTNVESTATFSSFA
jgi:hypothetical protein